jgi:hypothetical protein
MNRHDLAGVVLKFVLPQAVALEDDAIAATGLRSNAGDLFFRRWWKITGRDLIGGTFLHEDAARENAMEVNVERGIRSSQTSC